MAVAGGAAAEGQCTPEEEAENREQQVNEMDMIQSIFEGQFVLLGQNMEYMVNSFISGDGFRGRGVSALVIMHWRHSLYFFLAPACVGIMLCISM